MHIYIYIYSEVIFDLTYNSKILVNIYIDIYIYIY